jgi:hypothetical protein
MQFGGLDDRLRKAVAQQRVMEGARRAHELAEYVKELQKRGLDPSYYEHKLARLRVQIAQLQSLTGR